MMNARPGWNLKQKKYLKVKSNDFKVKSKDLKVKSKDFKVKSKDN